MQRLLSKKLFFIVSTLSLAFTQLEAHSAPATAQQASAATDFTRVAREAIPSVVSIKVQSRQANRANSFFNDDFWQQFFNAPNAAPEQEQQVIGQGSGFIVSEDGYVLTNNHVVKEATSIDVTLPDGREYTGQIIGTDPFTDIAVVKIDAQNLPFLKLGDSDAIEVGQWAIAIGNPFGLNASLTVGVISAKGRNNLDITREENFIQTDAAINRGNSGGPLLDIEGNVIGINTAIATSSGGYMGVGFAIPSNMAKRIMDQLIADGKVVRGFLGVSLQEMDQNLAQAFKLENSKGALIADVSRGSPADKAGLKQGDVVLKINGKAVENISSLRNEVAQTKPGTTITLTVMRDQQTVDIPVEVGTFSDGQQANAELSSTLGLTVQNLTPEISQQLGYQNEAGVVITAIDPNSIAAMAGIKKGSLIIAVNQEKVSNVDEFHQTLSKAEKGKPVLLLIKQGQMMRFISLKMP